MKGISKNSYSSEQVFESAKVLVDLRGTATAFVQSGTITYRNRNSMIFIDDNSGGGSLILNGKVTLKTTRNPQAYRIPFEITSWEWGGMASPNANSNVTIICFN